MKVYISEEVRREIDKHKAYNQTAQECLKKIYTELCNNTRKMHGQTLNAYNLYAPEDVKGDLNILYSCIQLQPHVQKVILFTCDIGFCSLAITNDVPHCNVATIRKCLGDEINEPPASLIKEEVTFLPNYDALDKMNVIVDGRDIPPCVKDFNSCQFHSKLVFTLGNIVKFTKMTPVQRFGIPFVMAGRDVIVYSQTGSGKTATYLLPIINNILKNNTSVMEGKPIALILSPTRHLAIQVRMFLM